MATTGQRTILFLAADPTDETRLRLGEEQREIWEKLRLSNQRDRFRLETRTSVRVPDLTQALLDVNPQIVHFSGHAITEGLYFENVMGQAQAVSPEALADLFELVSDQVECVLLNACYSEAQATTIAEHIPFVIGMNQDIGDKAAIAFATGFYQALGAGRSYEQAYRFGCTQIRLQGIPEDKTPVLFKKEGAVAATTAQVKEASEADKNSGGNYTINTDGGMYNEGGTINVSGGQFFSGPVHGDITYYDNRNSNINPAQSFAPSPDSGQAANKKLAAQERAAVRKYLTERFSLGELKDLASDLGINYENLPHSTVSELARELLAHCERQRILKELLAQALASRADSDMSTILQEL